MSAPLLTPQSPAERCHALLQQARKLLGTDNKLALDLCTQAIKLAEALRDVPLIRTSRLSRAELYIRLVRFSPGRGDLMLVERMLQQQANPHDQAWCKRLHGFVAYFGGNIRRALDLVQQGEKLLSTEPNSLLKAQLASIIAVMHTDLHDYPEAFRQFETSADRFAQLPVGDQEPESVARLLLNHARMLLDLNLVEAAEPEVERGASLSRAHGLRFQEFVAQRLLAKVLLEQGKLDQALRLLVHGLRELDHRMSLAQMHALLAQVHRRRNDDDAAYDQLLKAQHLFAELEMNQLLAGVQCDLAEIWMARRDWTEAETCLKTGISAAEAVQDYPGLVRAHRLLQQVFVQRKKPAEAATAGAQVQVHQGRLKPKPSSAQWQEHLTAMTGKLTQIHPPEPA